MRAFGADIKTVSLHTCQSLKLSFGMYANQKRDFVVRNQLQKKKIKCLVVWECSIKKMQKSEEIQIGVLNTVSDFLTSKDYFMEL